MQNLSHSTSLGSRSRNGEALRFGDGVTQTAYPGVLIESMDFEELAAWLAIRNSQANHPCPTWLVHHNDLHKLSERFDRRTSDSMQAVLAQTKYLNATEREEILKSYGLQNFDVCQMFVLSMLALATSNSISFGRSTTPIYTQLQAMIYSVTLTVENGGAMFGLPSKNTFKRMC
jgi:hypothetical protein